MKDVVITSAVRTPIGKYNGSLSRIGATELGGMIIKEAIIRSGIAKEEVNEVIMGMVLPCGYGQNPARQAAIKAGIPWEVGCLTVNKVCGSGLKAVMLAAQAIQAGDADVIVAGGMENMSMAPYYLDKARTGYRLGNDTLYDHMINDGLWDNVNDFHMGMGNELCSEKYNVTRAEQDAYAAESYRRAMSSTNAGKFHEEIMSVPIQHNNREETNFSRDECCRETGCEALGKLKPAFKKDGVTTAGNAAAIGDGAAAVVVMAREKAEKLGCKILATVGPQTSAGLDMKYALTAPIFAIPKCLKKIGLDTGDVDLYEINEAFSGSTVTVIKELDLNPSIVNVNGGSVSLGHPIGASGCRILVTLLYEMIHQEKKLGLASLCLGAGEAGAMLIKSHEAVMLIDVAIYR